jgi:hydroxypyruvate isomerase
VTAPATAVGPTLHPNISMLFTEVALLDRPAAARAAGFDAVECWWPFDGPEPPDRDVERFVAAVRDAGVRVAAMNLDGGDLAAGDRGVLSDPEQTERFARGLAVGVDLARRLEVPVLHALYGNRRLGVDPRAQDDLAIEQLGMAAAAAAEVGATVVVEALNPWENPHYPWHRTAQVVGLIDRVRQATGETIACLYDLYHAQRSEGEVIATIRRYADRFGHVQLAGAPGRNEPGTGELAMARVLSVLRDSGYRGGIGLEYVPTTSTHASLDGLDELRSVLADTGGDR